MALQGVLFDLDDTLADSSGIEQQVWLEVVELIAQRYPHVDREALRERYVGVLESHYADHAVGLTDFLTYRRRRLEDALSPWGDVDDELFEQYVTVKDRCIHEVEPVDGALEVIGYLRRYGVRVGLLTNGPPWMQRRKLEVSGLDEAFDAVAISGEIGVAKPAAEAFTTALTLLGTEASRTAMVGDSFVNDVEGALGAGLGAVVWMNPGSEAPCGVDTARHLGEVPALLGFA